VPRRPEWLDDHVDVERPTSRFTLSPAVALGFPEEEWSRLEDEATEALRERYGDWIYEEQEGLGRAEARAGGVGRGAEGLAAILIFIGINAAAGIISVSAGMAWKRFLERVKRSRRNDSPRIYISRGGAALLAVAEVAERFGGDNDLELEAVEEPSSIAGGEISELAYVGLEPWIVLLRDREKLRRYVVVVSGRGEVLGALDTPIEEWEAMFLPEPGEQPAIRARPKRRRSWRRR
jgi:hypothetical protein